MQSLNDIDCEQEKRTFVRRVATAETGNLVPLGPPRSRYLCRKKLNLYEEELSGKSAEEVAY